MSKRKWSPPSMSGATLYRFGSSSTHFYFAAGFSHLKTVADPKSTILLTDQNIFHAHPKKFRPWDTIVIKAGEEQKVQATADAIIAQLIERKADRRTTLVGVGGGVITDITGYVAAVYMRGLRFGFVPTSLLGLVDASIGGKNGIDVGIYKNLVGTIRQPGFILHDMAFLDTLPQQQWENGFAEIIKHACIKDATMFRELEKNSLATFQGKKTAICELVQRNAQIKAKVVRQDEFEKNERRLLNFGHTLGHAIENQYELMHGHAVSIGMTYACHISEMLAGFTGTPRVVQLLERYGLPTYFDFDRKKALQVLAMDKKREQDHVNYVLLEKIGKGIIKPVSLKKLTNILTNL